MKKFVLRGCVAGLISITIAGMPAVAAEKDAASPFEITGALVAGIPGSGDFDVYDSNFGARIECRYWTSETLGLEAWLGMEQWNAGGGSRNWGAEAEGDLMAIPIGVSGLMRLAQDAPVSVTLKAGLGYVMADSDLRFKDGEQIEVNDSWVAEAGLDLGIELTDQLSLFAGTFYRLDLSTGDASVKNDGPLEDNQFEGINFALGLKLAL